jgi:hypothetical protein
VSHFAAERCNMKELNEKDWLLLHAAYCVCVLNSWKYVACAELARLGGHDVLMQAPASIAQDDILLKAVQLVKPELISAGKPLLDAVKEFLY